MNECFERVRRIRVSDVRVGKRSATGRESVLKSVELPTPVDPTPPESALMAKVLAVRRIVNNLLDTLAGGEVSGSVMSHLLAFADADKTHAVVERLAQLDAAAL